MNEIVENERVILDWIDVKCLLGIADLVEGITGNSEDADIIRERLKTWLRAAGASEQLISACEKEDEDA